VLVIVEFDAIDPGNAPRWLLGYQAVGLWPDPLRLVHLL
jgi:hypothetical protein